MPRGSLIYDTVQADSFNFAGNVNEYTVTLGQGETASVRLTPQDPSIQAHLELLGPAGNLVAEADGPAGGTAILQTAPVTMSGTYTIRAVSVAGTGAYQLELYANAALDTTAWGGVSDNTPATAQSIDGSAISSPQGAQRLAVLGTSDGADHYYAFTLTAGRYPERRPHRFGRR